MTDNARIDDDDEQSDGPAAAGAEDPLEFPPEVAPEVRAARAEDAALVERARSGDPEAFGRLYDRWFDRVHALVRNIVRDVDTCEEVCQETFLTAWQSLDKLLDPLAFGGWLLRSARNRALKRVEREKRSRPVDDAGLAVIEQTGGSAGVSAPAGFDLEADLGCAQDPSAAVASSEVVALVHEAVATLGPRDAEVLELQLRSELTPAEIGEVMGLNRNAANQLCHRVRGRFATAFRARMLWHGGRPTCAALGAELSVAGITAFSAEAVTIADRHAAACNACGERRRTLVAPGALFAAVPLLPAPVVMKARIAGRLARSGVPMDGSTASVGSVSSGSGQSPGSGETSGSGSGSGSTNGPSAGLPGAPTVGSSAAPASAGAAVRSMGSAARRVALAAGIAVLVLVIAVVLLARRADRHDDLLAAADEAATSTTIAGRPAPEGTSETTTGEGQIGSGADAGSVTGDRASPGDPATTTTIAPTTTTAAPASLDLLELTPSTTQASPYDLGPTGPLLRWKVRNASQVQVWLLSDTGGGLSRTRVLSTDHDGELRVCPGSIDGTSCYATTGTYAFEIEAVGLDGVTVVTDPSVRPSFDVVPVID